MIFLKEEQAIVGSLREYYQEIKETERRKQNLENLFDGAEA